MADKLDNARKAVKDTVDDAKDAISEARHRSAAEAEAIRREAEGDTMSTGDKVGSVVNEAKNRTQAEIDEAKRRLRDAKKVEG